MIPPTEWAAEVDALLVDRDESVVAGRAIPILARILRIQEPRLRWFRSANPWAYQAFAVKRGADSFTHSDTPAELWVRAGMGPGRTLTTMIREARHLSQRNPVPARQPSYGPYFPTQLAPEKITRTRSRTAGEPLY